MTENEVINNLACIREEIKDDKYICKETRYKTIDLAIAAIEEVRQYRTIGTVEEFREAREKQQAKKPNAKVQKKGWHEAYILQ